MCGKRPFLTLDLILNFFILKLAQDGMNVHSLYVDFSNVSLNNVTLRFINSENWENYVMSVMYMA